MQQINSKCGIKTEDINSKYAIPLLKELEKYRVLRKGILLPEAHKELSAAFDKVYGINTLVFIQNGKFFEFYCTKNQNSNSKDDIQQHIKKEFLMSPAIGFRAGNEKNDKDFYMFGIPLMSSEKYMNLIVQNGYNVVEYHQKCDTGDGSFYRILGNILTVGTFIQLPEDTSGYGQNQDEQFASSNNCICCTWIERIKSSASSTATAEHTLYIGYSYVNICTGYVGVMEYTTPFCDDGNIMFDKLHHAFCTCDPIECIFVSNISKNELNSLLIVPQSCKRASFFQITHTASTSASVSNPSEQNQEHNQEQTQSQLFSEIAKRCEKQAYQDDLFQRFYPSHNIFTHFYEYEYIRCSLAYLLDFLSVHNRHLVEKLAFPSFDMDSRDTVLLANHSLMQLNIIDNYQIKPCKTSSVVNLLNDCITPMGRREFRYTLLHPILSCEELQRRYDLTDLILQESSLSINANKAIETITSKELPKVRDLSRIERILISSQFRTIQPKMVADIYTGALIAIKIWNILVESFSPQFLHLFFKKHTSTHESTSIEENKEDMDAKDVTGQHILLAADKILHQIDYFFDAEMLREKSSVQDVSPCAFHCGNCVYEDGTAVELDSQGINAEQKSQTERIIQKTDKAIDDLFYGRDTLIKIQQIMSRIIDERGIGNNAIARKIKGTNSTSKNNKTSSSSLNTLNTTGTNELDGDTTGDDNGEGGETAAAVHELFAAINSLKKNTVKINSTRVKTIFQCNQSQAATLAATFAEDASAMNIQEQGQGQGQGQSFITTTFSHEDVNLIRSLYPITSKKMSSGSSMQIESKQLTKLCDRFMDLKNEVAECSADYYGDSCFHYFLRIPSFIDAIHTISEFITNIDLVLCRASLVHKHHLSKPTISRSHQNPNNVQKSFVRAKHLRYCLIEANNPKEIYVPNDVCLGCELVDDQSTAPPSVEQKQQNGMLIFGTNMAGKTSFVRAVGVSIIMAQAGLYVSAESYEYYPYKSIYTRIIGNDNLFRQLSTFAVEMMEFKVILANANEHSLVLGDELCSGTETISATLILSAGLCGLHRRKCSFIFATHFHEIMKWDEVKQLEGWMNAYHVSLRFCAERNRYEMVRTLAKGSGNACYGLDVCKNLCLPLDMLHDAYEMGAKYYPEVFGGGHISSCNVSGYNAAKVKRMCERCGKELAVEVHHEVEQQEADEMGVIRLKDGRVFHKNHLANLGGLCHACHVAEHFNS